MKRFGKVDKNQKEIVDALREAGASVQSLASVGNGCPDLLVGFAGYSYLMEVKQLKGTYTKEQKKWISEWGGDGVHTVRSKHDALKIIKGKK